jgi:outer membrane protein OmpA-like peptidoglycan-associated protein
MKRIITIVFCLFFLVLGKKSIAQNVQYQSGITFKTLLMDYQSQNDGSFTSFNDYHHGFEISYSRNLQNKLNLVVPLKIGVVNTDIYDINKFDQGRSLHKTIYGLDAQIQYQFYTPEKQIVPYVLAGIGFVGENEGKFNMQTPLGLGVQIKVAPNANIVMQGEYRFSFTEGRNNLQYGLGFNYLFGKGVVPEKEEEKEDVGIDSDNDGVIDNLDLCPQIAGLKELNGCPDSDGDGIADYQDKCPGDAGLKSLAGCPDSDGDGVSDVEDKCPDIAGLVDNDGCPDGDRDNDGVPNSKDNCPDIAGPESNGGCPPVVIDADKDGIPDDQDVCPNLFGSATANGCPDRDGDGTPDSDDKCPSTFGPAVYNGCPDTDGDGIDDGRDRCPNTAGPVSTNGCPEISQADQKVLQIAMRAVQFDSGRSTLKSESFSVLKQIADIMKRYPDYNLMISGHTDNTGTATANQKLSERRAKACYEYLTTQGVSAGRLNFAGYGESRPISDNNSLRGRSLNRRVEFNLVPSRG